MLFYLLAFQRNAIPEDGPALSAKPGALLSGLSLVALAMANGYRAWVTTSPTAGSTAGSTVAVRSMPDWYIYVLLTSALLAAATTIFWLQVLCRTLRWSNTKMVFGRRWVTVGWLLPPGIPIIPALQFSEISRATATPGASRRGPQPLILVWFSTVVVWTYTQWVAFRYWIDAIDAKPPMAPVPSDTTPRFWVLAAAWSLAAAAIAYVAMSQAIARRHDAFVDAIRSGEIQSGRPQPYQSGPTQSGPTHSGPTQSGPFQSGQFRSGTGTSTTPVTEQPNDTPMPPPFH